MDTSDIEGVCNQLNEEALSRGFFNASAETIEAGVDQFVQHYCREHRLTSHLISPRRWSDQGTHGGVIAPFRWSFDRDGYGIGSGVVEFEPKGDALAEGFICVDVFGARLGESRHSQQPTTARNFSGGRHA